MGTGRDGEELGEGEWGFGACGEIAGTLDDLQRFEETLGLSTDLGEALPDTELLDEMTDHVMGAKNLLNNPRPVIRSDVEAIWQRALSGSLG